MTKTFEAWYKKYVSECNRKYDDNISILENKTIEAIEKAGKIAAIRLRTASDENSNLDQKVELANDEVYSLQSQLKSLKKIREEMDTRKIKLTTESVYKKLLRHPKIEKINISENSLNVYTKKLKVNNYMIGDYKLTFSLPGSFYIENLEYVVDNCYDHWHVNNKEPCLASWKPIMWKQIDTYQLFLFIDTLIHYLLLSNDSHAYMPFSDWIKKFEEKKKLPKRKESDGYISVADAVEWVSTGTTVGDITSSTNSYTYWSTAA